MPCSRLKPSAQDRKQPDHHVHPLAAQYYRAGIPWAYSELPPWPASAIYEYQLVIVGIFLLSAVFIAATYLTEMGSLLLESIALVILRSVERSRPGTGQRSRFQLRLVTIARQLLQITLRGRERLAERSDSP